MSRPVFGRATSRASVVAVLASLFVVGCSGSSGSSDAGPAGGPVQGAKDAHCAGPDGGLQAQPTSDAACHVDGGMVMGDGGSAYGDTLFNAEGFDDDCKYHLSWTSTPIRRDTDVTFSVTVTSSTSGAPVTGAGILSEVYLTDTHPAPNAPTRTAESAGGVYAVGPIRFDAAGRWTVRFHLFESCSDFSPESPHGHAAYYVDVP